MTIDHDRGDNDPSPEQIEERKAEIQSRWTAEVWIERRRGSSSRRWAENVAQFASGTTHEEPAV
jgi:hypothetical protein